MRIQMPERNPLAVMQLAGAGYQMPSRAVVKHKQQSSLIDKDMKTPCNEAVQASKRFFTVERDKKMASPANVQLQGVTHSSKTVSEGSANR